MTPAGFRAPRWLRRVIACTLLLGAAAAWPLPRALAEPSLAAEDVYARVPTPSGLFTLLRDRWAKEHWYYLPDQVRLTEVVKVTSIETTRRPEFYLLRYHRAGPGVAAEGDSGGLLQFSVQLAAPEPARRALTEYIAKWTKTPPALIRLEPLPLTDARIAVYAPGGTLITSRSRGASPALRLDPQKAVFSLELDRFGPAFYDEITRGKTGIPLSMVMSFGGLTPRGPYRVAVDWTLAYDYYEDLINAGATASTFGFFGGLTSQKLFHDLQKARVIQVHAADGSDASPEDFYKFIDPLLARINSELLRDAAPPGTVDASGFHQATQRGRFLGGDYRVALRARTDVRSGAGQVDFTVRTRQEAHARADGLLGVAPYLKRMRESDLVSTVEAGEWDDAYLMLPAILRRQSFGVRSATLAVRFAAGDETLGSSVFSWAPRRGWTDESGEPRGVAHFHFGTARQPRTDLRFETTLSLDTVHGSQQIASSVPAFTGKRAIASLRESFEVIGFDATLAPWQFGDGVSVQRGDLQEIALRVEAGGSVHAATLRTRQVGRATLPPLPVQFLLPRDRGPVRVTATMRRGGRIYRWRHNDAKDVRARLADPSLITLHVSPGEWIDASK